MALQKEVRVGQVWIAKVSQKLTEVEILRIDPARESFGMVKRSRCVVKNLRTNRVVEMTAAKLRRLISSPTPNENSSREDCLAAARAILDKLAGGNNA